MSKRSRGLHLVERHGHWHIHGTLDGHRYRLSTKTADLRRARQKLADLIFQHDAGWRGSRSAEPADWHTLARVLTRRQRQGAKAREIPFNVEAGHVFRLMSAAGFRCAVSGIPFARRLDGDIGANPWGPSIDRIENSQGYMPDNVRIVCVAANVAMNRWGYDVLLRLSTGVIRSAALLSQEPEPPPLPRSLQPTSSTVGDPLAESAA